MLQQLYEGCGQGLRAPVRRLIQGGMGRSSTAELLECKTLRITIKPLNLT